MQRNLNWLNIYAYNYNARSQANITQPRAALYHPTSEINTDFGMRAWIARGLSAKKLVTGLPFFGYAWALKNPQDNAIGALATFPATGPAISTQGIVAYKDIKQLYIQRYGVAFMYDATYVMNYCLVGSTFISFDDVEAIKNKVSYAKEMGLLGYYAMHVANDVDWVLSLTADSAQTVDINEDPKVEHFGSNSYYIYSPRSLLNVLFKEEKAEIKSYTDIEKATKGFSIENKLGEGGFGPIYKGVLANGQEITVKLLSKGSKQGFEEFKNEVILTAKLQHVNLVRVLGFCVERDEQMLIYEYMPNKSLDLYLFDLTRRLLLDWNERVHIIGGITDGLLYLQEYSRFTIIHRDSKASNILLDNKMKPKISDFGMAKIFTKDEHEANTGRVVGTYGYIPPEYIRRGLYSVKSDVYSFGVLLLQIISGQKNAASCNNDLTENLTLLEYAYDLWKSGKGMEFMDPSLDDTHSSCEIAALAIPKKPAYSKGNEDEEKKSEWQQEYCSINDITISEMLARS
ncbi:putative cysteine-rich receptor-like protein kinase 35 [Juglans microcarpa x Juglans regia]|uniref:putative cysteine-rich receptor-like protein kinase 35 n=1 Tax=Juglans microcarpa x Juglans regia TaxID=2249226 RepID=UPI001B7DD232|nr:putative cysteine-rich receptor-like protein kinase 35 [Juglans microcarpa x Juglans regia]